MITTWTVMDTKAESLAPAPSGSSFRMTGEEYRVVLKLLRLTHEAAAAFLGVHEATSIHCAGGKFRVPQAVGMLLRLMIAMRMTPQKARSWLNMEAEAA